MNTRRAPHLTSKCCLPLLILVTDCKYFTTDNLSKAQAFERTAQTAILIGAATADAMLTSIPGTEVAAIKVKFDQAVIAAQSALQAFDDLMSAAIAAGQTNPDLTAATAKVVEAIGHISDVIAEIKALTCKTQCTSVAAVELDRTVGLVRSYKK